MTLLGLSVHDVLTTTRSVRKRLDFDRSVDDNLLRECLDYAVQAPTGSNSQGWRFVVVTDPEKKAGLGELYRRGWEQYAGMSASALSLAGGEDSERATQQMRVMQSAAYLAENMHRVPAMVIPCLPGRINQSGFGAPGASCWQRVNVVSAPAGRLFTFSSKKKPPNSSTFPTKKSARWR
jgi:nitroreductase